MRSRKLRKVIAEGETPASARTADLPTAWPTTLKMSWLPRCPSMKARAACQTGTLSPSALNE